jgi:hypothetical protein
MLRRCRKPSTSETNSKHVLVIKGEIMPLSRSLTLVFWVLRDEMLDLERFLIRKVGHAICAKSSLFLPQGFTNLGFTFAS